MTKTYFDMGKNLTPNPQDKSKDIWWHLSGVGEIKPLDVSTDATIRALCHDDFLFFVLVSQHPRVKGVIDLKPDEYRIIDEPKQITDGKGGSHGNNNSGS